MPGRLGSNDPSGSVGNEGKLGVGFGMGLGIPTVGGRGNGELDPGEGNGFCAPPCCPEGVLCGDP
ncbi:MAG: hypothetical protein F4X44_11180 [Gammaproteobacteria bacterium]|nr:hypothetical protein [Gammaproteobacteria bacterium]